MNTPNKLTLIRIMLVPFFIFFLLYNKIPHNFLIAGIIFGIASFTDYLDGKITRKYNLVTDFGKFADPLADKLLICASMLVLMEENRLWGWVVAIILAREFAVTGLRSIAAAKGHVIAASMWGKSKTVSQMIMIVILLLHNWPLSIFYIHFDVYIPTDIIAIVIATLLTIISGVDYFVKNKELLKDM